MSDIVQGTILVVAILCVVLMGLLLYLINLVLQLQEMVNRLRHPEVPRDWDGRARKERL